MARIPSLPQTEYKLDREGTRGRKRSRNEDHGLETACSNRSFLMANQHTTIIIRSTNCEAELSDTLR